MTKWIDPVALLVAFVTVAIFVGCPASDDSNQPGSQTASSTASRKMPIDQIADSNDGFELESAGTTHAETTRGNSSTPGERSESQSTYIDSASPPAELPAVILSDQHKEASLFRVGDSLAEFSARDSSGTAQSIGDHSGQGATLVVFWTAEEPTSLEQLGDLSSLVLSPYTELGVNVVLVNAVQNATMSAGHLENVDDRAISLFAEMVEVRPDETGRPQLPQTFVLDRDGNVIWYDVEYSSTTRRDLDRALRHVLGLPEAA